MGLFERLPKVDIMKFVVSRFSRLMPVYWFSIIFTYILVLYFGLPGREVGLFDFLVNFTLLQEFLKIPHVDGAYWTLVVEITFYAWVALLILFKSHDFIFYFLLTSSIFAVSGDFFQIDYNVYVSKLLILKYIPFFLMGFVLYGFRYGMYPKLFGKPILALGAFVSLLHIMSLDYVGIIVVVSFILAMIIFLYGDFEAKIYGPLVWLGTISYPLYLLHQNIGYVIIIKVSELFGSEILGILTALLFVVLAAGIVHKYIEMPSTAFIRSSYLKVMKA